MKIAIYLSAVLLLFSFTKHSADDIDGIWMGFRSDGTKEKVIVKFRSEDKMEFYAGGVGEENKCEGSYRLSGDSVSFTYTTSDGRQFRMNGHLNFRKNYLNGTWTGSAGRGKFYLERQKVEERFL